MTLRLATTLGTFYFFQRLLSCDLLRLTLLPLRSPLWVWLFPLGSRWNPRPRTSSLPLLRDSQAQGFPQLGCGSKGWPWVEGRAAAWGCGFQHCQQRHETPRRTTVTPKAKHSHGSSWAAPAAVPSDLCVPHVKAQEPCRRWPTFPWSCTAHQCHSCSNRSPEEASTVLGHVPTQEHCGSASCLEQGAPSLFKAPPTSISGCLLEPASIWL